jgi:thiol-disulfide isomerase/thioredoxin
MTQQSHFGKIGSARMLKAGMHLAPWWVVATALFGLCACNSSSGKEAIMISQESTIARLRVEGELPSLEHATNWLNSAPLSAADLRGKVVLVDFWTYTCINWRRTLPYLRTWAEKYRDSGLVVVGVHTPEFGFEKDIDNVRQASKEQAINYPIAIDTDYAVWNAFDNHYWPALYLIDAQGRIRHHQFGEGNYDHLEVLIRQLLAEAGRNPPEGAVSAIEGKGAEAEANWRSLKSQETYLSHSRSSNFASPQIAFLARVRNYTTPARLRLNQWGLTGNWVLGNESAHSIDAGGRLTYRFHARDVHLVMGAIAADRPVRFRVLIDGHPPGAAHGVDIDEQGNGKMDAPRMYQLIRQRDSIADRNFEIEFLDSGAEVFVFTFG